MTAEPEESSPDAADVLPELRAWVAAHRDPELSLARWRGLLAGPGAGSDLAATCPSAAVPPDPIRPTAGRRTMPHLDRTGTRIYYEVTGSPGNQSPLLLSHGFGASSAFRPAASYLTAKIPGAVQVVVPGAGHMSNVDQPDQFNQAVLAFLGHLPKDNPP